MSTGFRKGTTNSFLYDGEFLADTQDVIVVSAKYAYFEESSINNIDL